MSQLTLSSFTGRSVFRIGRFASTIEAFFPTHENSYASSPSMTESESICLSISKLIAFFKCPSSSRASVTQFGNIAAIFLTFSCWMSSDSILILSIIRFLLAIAFYNCQSGKWLLLELAYILEQFAYLG